eukprot:CAMPEP_0184689988 /NCGR_PEP_ID=MMETSP0312-20130426/30958_1 /TAXON_ID=31354 /ORGANISM="Compsopogon coeruleus, Strain SAG 36.94" /LENGTH=705 /DNA_ID=CAMNT_0027147401 /DNA_START=795 /DNA_END=2912 /DNA_ORIENTATION=+
MIRFELKFVVLFMTVVLSASSVRVESQVSRVTQPCSDVESFTLNGLQKYCTTGYSGKVFSPTSTVCFSISDFNVTVEWTAAQGVCFLPGKDAAVQIRNDVDFAARQTLSPGLFPCKKTVTSVSSGCVQTMSVTCPLSDFNLNQCCDAHFYLFAHIVTIEGGTLTQTSWGGAKKCDTSVTKQWCAFSDVLLSAQCGTCKQCMIDSSGVCEALPLGSREDSRCQRVGCNGQTPFMNQCDGSGTCTNQSLSTCHPCAPCDQGQGQCSALPGGATPTGCDDVGCDGQTPFMNQCDGSGTCTNQSLSTCHPCAPCDQGQGQCSALPGGATPTGCNNVGCDGQTPFMNQCDGSGTCTNQSLSTCHPCAPCDQGQGQCSALPGGATPTGCDDVGCDGQTPFMNQCDGSGTCTNQSLSTCHPCAPCDQGQGQCSALPGGATPTGCDDVGCDGQTPFMNQCDGIGTCTNHSLSACGTCQVCTAESGTCANVPVLIAKQPDGASCCYDGDCVSGLCSGGICTPVCDSSKCFGLVNVAGEEVCSFLCSSCVQQCDGGTCNSSEAVCTTCSNDSDCPAGESCDGKFCSPVGICTARKNVLCDDVYSFITGKTDERAKCCPSTSGCTKDELNQTSTAVCSTTCGSCLGVIGGTLTDYPKVLCEFKNSSLGLGLPTCFDGIAANGTMGSKGCTGDGGDGTVCCANDGGIPAPLNCQNTI